MGEFLFRRAGFRAGEYLGRAAHAPGVPEFNRFREPTVQVASEAKASPIITIFTIGTALRNIPQGDKSRGKAEGSRPIIVCAEIWAPPPSARPSRQTRPPARFPEPGVPFAPGPRRRKGSCQVPRPPELLP